MIILLLTGTASLSSPAGHGQAMTREEALRILNDSPWARQQTVTDVVEGIGSGVYGEKEIFGRYFVRILSAPPIQEAFRRVREILQKKGPPGAGEPEPATQEAGAVNFDRYLAVAVSFRSNHPVFEQRVYNFFQAQTAQTLKTHIYLSTERFPQVEFLSYHLPRENAFGAVFVFPKQIDGIPVISEGDESFVFEADFPRGAPDVRVIFPVSGEVVSEGKLPRQAGQDSEPLERLRTLINETTRMGDPDAKNLSDVVNVFEVQKRGTIHGSVYNFHRNDNLDARNFFDPPRKPLPEFKRNQFGANTGWTVSPRFHVFGSYEGLRIIQGSTILSHVPTPAMKTGDFSEFLSGPFIRQIEDPDTGEIFSNNTIPEHRIHPVSRRLLSVIPDPNRLDPDRNFVNNQPFVLNQDETSFLVDFGIDEERQISLRYNYRRGDGLEPHPFPFFTSQRREREQDGSISYAQRFSESLTSRWELEFSRQLEVSRSEQDRPPGLLDSLGIEGVALTDPENEGYPPFDITGYRSFGDEGVPEGEVSNDLALDVDFSYISGNHDWRIEAEIGARQLHNSRSPALERGAFSFSGIFTGDGFADFLLGRADEARRAVGSSRQDLRRWFYQFGVTDRWKISSRFALTLGLGWSYFAPYRSTRPNISTFHPLLFEPPLDGELVIAGSRRAAQLGLHKAGSNGMVFPDYNNWRPRLGLAYRPFESNWLVIRGSYDISYDPLESWIFENYMGRNLPFYYVELSQASTDSSGLDIGSPFRTRTPTETTIRAISERTRTPYDQEWQVDIQNEITPNWTVELGYRGRKGTGEVRILPANVPSAGPGPIQPRRPNSDFGRFSIVTGGGSSEFHELELNAEKRLADGYSLRFEFEWRRRFDDRYEGDPSNPRNLDAEWAAARFPDRSFSLHYIVDLPFWRDAGFQENPSILGRLFGGWRVSGITQVSSGGRFSVLLPGDPNNDGVGGDRPDRIASGILEADRRSIDQWFDTEAFVLPGPFQFGNAGRNILTGPPFHNWDISLIKEAVLPNRHRLQVRFAFFNAFNRPNLEIPNRVFGTRLFGKISGAKRAREIEIALKYSF